MVHEHATQSGTRLPLPQKNQNTIVFNASSEAQLYKNVAVRGNFIVAGGQMGGWEAMPSAGVVFRGVPPLLVNTVVVVQVRH